MRPGEWEYIVELRKKSLEQASQIMDIDDTTIQMEVIAGLIELSGHAGGGRGFNLVLGDGHETYLDDRKSPGDHYCHGLSEDALRVLKEIVTGR